MKRPRKITSYIKRTILLLTIVTSILVAGLIMLNAFIRYSKQKIEFKSNYIAEQKEYIKYVAQNELEYISNQKIRLEDQAYDELKMFVLRAEKMAMNLSQIYDGKLNEDEIKRRILDALSSYGGIHNRSVVYVTTTDGVGVRYPNHPEFTGKNLIELRDVENNLVVKSELELLRDKNDGFITYDYNSKSQNKQKYKIAYVKKLNLFNWYLSSYKYLDDHYNYFQDEIIYRISSLRFINGGYVFLNQEDGTPLAMNGEVYTGNFNFFDGTDLNKTEVFKKEIEAAYSSPDGGYFYYNWNQIGDTTLVDKCSYSIAFPEWNWVLGAGFYLDDADLTIRNNFLDYRNEFLKNIFQLVVLLLFIILLEILLINRFNKKYLSDFNLFFKFFKKAAESSEKLKVSQFNFEEFKEAASAANKMLKDKDIIFADLVVQQEKAQESDQLKTAFLANMSHEIRTPMNAILGFSELLADKSMGDEIKEEYIALIRKNGDNLLHLINDIIDISKIEANQLKIKTKAFNIHAFINSSYLKNRSNLQKLINNKLQFELVNDLSPRLVLINDSYRLSQIIDNLLSNAFKFTNKGIITLKAYSEKEFFCIIISDTGIGIDSKEISNIFKRFRQVENDFERVYGGTGLGLAITENLVQMLKGTIEVESELGRGATFTVKLPINFIQEQ